jgi:hypothetical protein
MNTEGHKPGCKCISCIIERSSLGTPHAKKLRASVSDEQAARVVQRAAELEKEGHRLVGEIGNQRCICGWFPELGESVWRAFDKHVLKESSQND